MGSAIFKPVTVFLCLALAGCGTAYVSSDVKEGVVAGTKVRVLPVTPESVLVANRSTYRPKDIPAAFYQNAGSGGTALRGAGAAPPPTTDRVSRPGQLELRLPPRVAQTPYQIGVGDVLLLATPSAGSTVEELSGLLAAQNKRQGYTVQDDGAIAIPDIGRVNVAGLTLEEAEAEMFQRLVENQIDPSFSLEVAEFNSKRVSIGGAVGQPAVAPITLKPLYLDEALASAGGVQAEDLDFATVRIYRDGNLYQIPVRDLYSKRSLQKVQLVDGDSIFVDTEYELSKARIYFEEQIRLSEFRQSARVQALAELNAEVNLRRAALTETRANFKDRIALDAVKRDYVYLTGEVATQSRFAMPFGRKATLADALYSEGGFSSNTGNPAQIYVLRGSPNPKEFAGMTAWHLNATNAVNFLLATRLELRPNDVIFIAEQPVTRWNRVVNQITPTLISATIGAATD